MEMTEAPAGTFTPTGKYDCEVVLPAVSNAAAKRLAKHFDDAVKKEMSDKLVAEVAADSSLVTVTIKDVKMLEQAHRTFDGDLAAVVFMLFCRIAGVHIVFIKINKLTNICKYK